MKDQDEILPISVLAAEVSLPAKMVHSWITGGRKRKQPDKAGNTRVTLTYTMKNGKCFSTRRWVAEFMAVAELGKADLHIMLANLPNIE
jgi:hypothetical protein